MHSSGNLFQSFTTLWENVYFLISNLEWLFTKARLCPLVMLSFFILKNISSYPCIVHIGRQVPQVLLVHIVPQVLLVHIGRQVPQVLLVHIVPQVLLVHIGRQVPQVLLVLCPLVMLSFFILKNISLFNPTYPCIILKTSIWSPRIRLVSRVVNLLY